MRATRHIRARAATLLAALGAGALIALAGAGGAGASPITVAIDRGTVTAPLPSGFLGLALEVKTIPQWVGHVSSSATVDPVLVHLVRNLDPTGAPQIRIGGQSADRSWWPVPKVKQPIGVTYDLSPAWTTDARALAEALGAQLVLSVNLEADSTAITRYEADRLLAGVGRRYIAAMEIGNEPDQYTQVPWYNVLHGRDLPWYNRSGVPVYARPTGFSPQDFVSEFQRFLAVMPNVPIAGPDTDRVSWMSAFSRLLSRRGRIRILDSHSYPLASCAPLNSPTYPTIANMLSASSWQNVLAGVTSYVSLAHRDGLQYRVDEMGSVTCNGHAGVSDTMASALWVTDALFQCAREGVDGVNLHSQPGSTNGLFDLSESRAGAWSATVHPIYDGALMFARADPTGAELLRQSGDGRWPVQTWATIGRDHLVRVLIDNEAGDRNVIVHGPRSYNLRPAAVEQLRAPAVTAKTGVTVGGAPFSTTTTGVAPAPATATVKPGRAGYTVNVPADSETLLTLSPPPPAPRRPVRHKPPAKHR